jgi:hypothetical protein
VRRRTWRASPNPIERACAYHLGNPHHIEDLNMKSDVTRAAELACVLARVTSAPPHRIAEAVCLMRVAAKFAKRAAETRCSDPLTDEQDAALQRSEERHAEAARKVLAEIVDPVRAHLRLGGDPRGSCGALVVEGVPGDGWGGGDAGWPIY